MSAESLNEVRRILQLARTEIDEAFRILDNLVSVNSRVIAQVPPLPFTSNNLPSPPSNQISEDRSPPWERLGVRLGFDELLTGVSGTPTGPRERRPLPTPATRISSASDSLSYEYGVQRNEIMIRRRRNWSKEDEKELIRRRNNGEKYDSIGRHLGRTGEQCAQKIKTLRRQAKKQETIKNRRPY
jgi:hypothetical protein